MISDPFSKYVHCCDCEELVESLEDRSVDLFLFDPPYHEIVEEKWDNSWNSLDEYAQWFRSLMLDKFYPKLKEDGSIIFFGGVGSHGHHPFWKVVISLESAQSCLMFRNTITWQKRRAYGKSHDYLFCREEIAWFSASNKRTKVNFNIPLTNELRGYQGYNKKYPAKSPYKRVSNVWNDIPELMRPRRTAEKPVKLMERLVLTHSNPGQLVVDPFAGLGPTGVAAIKSGRRFVGCDVDQSACDIANHDCEALK